MTPAARYVVALASRVIDFTQRMPAGSAYVRAGPASGLTRAGTLQTFAANAPQRTDRGLALEPARTNFAFSSNVIAPAGAVTVTADAALAPDGSVTAVRVEKTSGDSPQYTALSNLMTVEVSTEYTASEFYKYDGDDTSASLEYNNTDNWGASWNGGFNIAAAGVSVGSETFCAVLVTSFGGGWYRPAATFMTDAVVGSPSDPTILGQITGGAGVSVLRFGHQLELGDYATSYIPTAGAAATRGLPSDPLPVPSWATKALMTYFDGSTSGPHAVTPGGTFDYVTPVIAAGKGQFGVSELTTLVWQP